MNKRFVGVLASLVLGAFLFCPKAEACDLDYLSKAGFSEWESEIECEPTNYILTDEEKELLMKIGVKEGGDLDPVAIAHVMQVVMNRVNSDAFPNTVTEVIFQKNPIQFCTAKKLSNVSATDAAHEALYAVIMGEYTDSEALYFESLPGIAWGEVHEYLFTYEGHDFYK